jgi:hypothetical protein
MISWLAVRRFNYIDSVGNGMALVCAAREHYGYALVVFIIGVMFSSIIEAEAKAKQ